MGRMNLKTGAKLHNKHHIILMDAKTGKVKKEGWAYNAILNQGFTRLIANHLKNQSTTSDGARFFGFGTNGFAGKTFIGTGTAAVNVSDTQMATYLDRKTNVYHAKEYNLSIGMASHTRKAVWSESEIQNTAITEVGLGIDNQTSGLVTRALIKDSEGNQITINKGATDILTIYSTVYMELSHLYGSNLGFVQGTMANGLLASLYYNAQPGTSFYLRVGKSKDEIAISNNAVKSQISFHNINFIGGQAAEVAFDASNKRIVVAPTGIADGARFGVAEGNDSAGIWEIGFSRHYGQLAEQTMTLGEQPIFRAVMPIAGVWPGTTITDEELGTGDSNTTIFQTTWAPVLSGTDVVKIDGVTKTRGTDYTINLATGEITFATAPGTGAAVTCTYGIEQIPKDSNHVLDIGFTIQFADGGI